MQSVTTEYLNTIAGPHQRSVKADLYLGEDLVYSLLPTVLERTRVSVDRNSKIRRSGSCTVGDPDFWQSMKENSGLIPYGAELKLYSGVMTSIGFEYVPLGVFQIEEAEADEAEGDIVSLTLYDRGKVIERNKFVLPTDYSGMSAKEALEDIVAVPPNLWTVTFDPTLRNPTLPGGTIFEGDRWDAVEKICDLLQADAYFDASGNLQVAPITEITATTRDVDAVWTIGSGGTTDTPVIVTASKNMSREGIYNAYVVIGAASALGGPVYGYAEDTDPNSPTFADGPFGRVIAPVIENDLITTSSAAQAAANAALRKTRGLARSVNFQCLENDALDVGDIVLFKFRDGSSELHVVDTLDLTNTGQMSGTTKTRIF